MALIGQLLDDLRMSLGHHAGKHDRRLHVELGQGLHSAENAAAMAVFGKAQRVQVQKAWLKGVPHRPDPRPVSIRPPLECTAKKDSEALPAGPAKILRKRDFLTAAMRTDVSHR